MAMSGLWPDKLRVADGRSLCVYTRSSNIRLVLNFTYPAKDIGLFCSWSW